MKEQLDCNIVFYEEFSPDKLLELWGFSGSCIPNLIITGERGGGIIHKEMSYGNLPKEIMKHFVISSQFDDRVRNRILHPHGGLAQSHAFSIVRNGKTIAMYIPNELNFNR